MLVEVSVCTVILCCHFKKSVDMFDEKEYLLLIKKKKIPARLNSFPYRVVGNLYFFCTTPILLFYNFC